MLWTLQFRSVVNRLKKSWITTPSLKADAVWSITTLIKAVERLIEQKEILHAEKKREVSAARQAADHKVRQASLVAARIDKALAEMQTDKRNGHGNAEKPAAILVSPYQSQKLLELTNTRRVKNSDDGWVHTYMSYPVYVCRGVYGPVVVTEDALAAMTRQAPELQMRAL